MKIITTSWDDGHPSDGRIADLLDKYNLKGTFYIPRANEEQDVMDESALLELSKKFEIGGHTLNHVRISTKSRALFEKEIRGCYIWLTELLGYSPSTFCFPGGVFNDAAIQYALESGFKLIRTTELLNPRFCDKNVIVPTTVQLYNHKESTYYRHLLRRFKFSSMALYARRYGTSKVVWLADYYLEYIRKNGGCFHLWGHSWEIDEYNLWNDLEDVFKLISNDPEFFYLENRELLQYKNIAN